jgi:hypothetical protein
MGTSHIINFLDTDYGEDYKTPNTNALLEYLIDCIIWENNLMLEAGIEFGYVESKTHIADSNITELTVSLAGSNFESDEGETWVTIKISVDEGSTWETVTRDTKYIVEGTGNRLKVKVELISLTTKISGIGILYK